LGFGFGPEVVVVVARKKQFRFVLQPGGADDEARAKLLLEL
jgi:hypothetical protein